MGFHGISSESCQMADFGFGGIETTYGSTIRELVIPSSTWGDWRRLQNITYNNLSPRCLNCVPPNMRQV